MISEYFATVCKASTLPGEGKHKDFKQVAPRTNYSAIEEFLLTSGCRKQALRFCLDGAFQSDHPTMTNLLHDISASCASLFTHLRRSIDDELPDQGESFDSLIADKEHCSPSAISAVSRRDAAQRNWVTNFSSDDFSDFRHELRQAYLRDYKISVWELGLPKLQYAQKVAFDDPKSKHRVVFHLGDFIRHTQSGQRHTLPLRIESIFIHRVAPTCPRLFLQVRPTTRLGTRDAALKAPLLCLSDSRQVIGLPGSSAKRLYVVELKDDDEDLAAARDGEVTGRATTLVEIDMDIQFM